MAEPTKRMNDSSLLVASMAQKCRALILESDCADRGLPTALQPSHLLWMCEQIELHAEKGLPTKLHRWIGFVQGAMLANRMLDLGGLKAMFDEAKGAHRDAHNACEDLIDHLDPSSSFEFDIGGQG
jgi:hypothetical protein